MRRRQAMATWPFVRISLVGGLYAEETPLNPRRIWTAAERRIRRYFGDGRLVRIARPDGGSNYTAPGRYQVTFRGDRGLTWKLTVDIPESRA